MLKETDRLKITKKKSEKTQVHMANLNVTAFNPMDYNPPGSSVHGIL